MARSGNITLSVTKLLSACFITGGYHEGPDTTYPFVPMSPGVTYTLKAGWIYFFRGYLIEDPTGVPLLGKTLNLYENGVLKESGITVYFDTVKESGSVGFPATGYYSAVPGSYVYYAEFPGDETHEGCASSTIGTALEAQPFPWLLFGLMAAVFAVPIVYFALAKPKKKG